MNRTLFFITLVAPMFCLAQQPSTQPAMEYDLGDMNRNLTGTRGVTLQLSTVTGIPIPPISEVNGVMNSMTWRLSGTMNRAVTQLMNPAYQENESAIRVRIGTAFETAPEILFSDIYNRVKNESAVPATNPARGRRGGRGAPGLPFPSPSAEQHFYELIRPEIDKIQLDMVSRLKALLRSEPAMSLPDRTKRVAEVAEALRLTGSRMQALSSLTSAQPNAPKRLAEKLRQLYDMEQGLQMRLTAQEARRKALQMGLAELKEKAEVERRGDPVTEEMRKITDLREAQLERTRQLAKNGVMNASEVARAEAELAETRLRLMERQAVIGKGGKGELMDRLTDELAMVSIDTTDLQIQIGQLREQISKNDPAKLSGPALDDLLRREPGLIPGGGDQMPPLYKELEKQAADLRLEWLKLVVDDVEIVPDASPQTQP